jgi:hypothetical protein
LLRIPLCSRTKNSQGRVIGADAKSGLCAAAMAILIIKSVELLKIRLYDRQQNWLKENVTTQKALQKTRKREIMKVCVPEFRV